MATVLASQSGASRTSPILRGNWISETLLGERLPRPPANVPDLPDSVPNGLTARELIERHSSQPECAKCHRRISLTISSPIKPSSSLAEQWMNTRSISRTGLMNLINLRTFLPTLSW